MKTGSFLLHFNLGPCAALQDSASTQKIKYDQSPVAPISFSKKRLADYRQDPELDYSEVASPDNWYTRTLRWLNDLYNSIVEWMLGGQEATGILKFLIEALPYLILLGVLVFLVWLFMKIDTSGSPLIGKRQGEVILSSEQEIIQSQDIQQLIDQALSQKNYRLAVRYSYLLVLQKLSQGDRIDWQVQKTNHDYIYEIKDLSLREQFSKVTRIYDFIWYGNFEVDDLAFAKAKTEFQKIAAAL